MLNAFNKVRWSPSGCENLLFALSEASYSFLGLMNTLGTFNIDIIVSASLGHLWVVEDSIRTFDNWGSRGNSDILSPNFVISPSSSSAYK